MNAPADEVVVHAGFPNPATDASLTGLDLTQLLVKHPIGTFLFRVEGREWEEQGIFAGDIAIVDRALDPRTADVVIWHSQDQTDFAISHCKYVPPEARVWGVITATIHQLRRNI